MRVGIDTQLFAKATPHLLATAYVLSLRRLEDSKQVDHVIRAFLNLRLGTTTLTSLWLVMGNKPAHSAFDPRPRAKNAYFLGEVDIQRAASPPHERCSPYNSRLTCRRRRRFSQRVEAQAAGTPSWRPALEASPSTSVATKGVLHDDTALLHWPKGIRRCLTDTATHVTDLLWTSTCREVFETRHLVEGYVDVYRSLEPVAQTEGSNHGQNSPQTCGTSSAARTGPNFTQEHG